MLRQLRKGVFVCSSSSQPGSCDGKQNLPLDSPADCLEVKEEAGGWEAEKLYGVEGQGPFDEF